MRRYGRGALIGYCLLILTAAVAARADDFEARQELKPERVLSGNTFFAAGKIISLWGVTVPDADPEIAAEAQLFLESMLFHGQLRCIPVRKRDGMSVMHCYIDDRDIGDLLVRLGLATAKDPFYADAQEQAKRDKVGMWKSRH